MEVDENHWQRHVASIKRLADQMCSAHASLSQRYSRYATGLDVLTFTLSLWGVALAFIDPVTNTSLSPKGIEPRIWLGVLAFFTGLLSLIHLPLNLKGRAEAHRSGLRQFSAVKTSAAHAMAKQGGASQKDYDNIKADYARAGQNSIEISEPEFLKQKQKHLRKVALSKALDKNPFANIMLMKVRLRFAHNRELLNGDIS